MEEEDAEQENGTDGASDAEAGMESTTEPETKLEIESGEVEAPKSGDEATTVEEKTDTDLTTTSHAEMPSPDGASGWFLINLGFLIVARSTLVVVRLLWWITRLISGVGEALAWAVEVMLILLPR